MIFALQLLHHQEVVPLGVVLRAGDAVDRCVGKRERERAFALCRCRRRDNFEDHLHRGVFAHDPGEFAFCVVVKLAAPRIGRGARDASGVKRGGVGDRDVAVDALEDRRMPVCHSVQLLSGRQHLLRPQGMVPPTALQPFACRRSFRGALNAVEHILQRFAAREIDRKLKSARIAEMCVRVVEAGHHKRPAKVHHLRLRPLGLEHIVVVAGRGDDAIAHGDGADEIKPTLAQPNAGQDVAVIVDGIGRRRLCGEWERDG